MSKKQKASHSNARFLKYCTPIIEVLRELGGSANAGEATDAVIDRLKIPNAELEELLPGGDSRVRKDIAFARFYLVSSGYVDSSARGIWNLTEKGRQTQFNNDVVQAIFREVQAKSNRNKSKTGVEEPHDEVVVDDPESPLDDYRTELISVLKALPPAGFERLCQRLLREAGFEQVIVTGRSGDGGIDGHGILELNPFVTYKVLFQCKRYQGSVGSPEIRNFRGAVQGRADKGIFMTTGAFTSDARNEARRDGATPIELVDGEKLVQMFEQLQLGLKSITTFQLDLSFFDAFR